MADYFGDFSGYFCDIFDSVGLEDRSAFIAGDYFGSTFLGGFLGYVRSFDAPAGDFFRYEYADECGRGFLRDS